MNPDSKKPDGRAKKLASKGPERKSTARGLGLVVFGVVFVGLFVGFAVAQGIGEPSIPSDAIAVVEDAPADIGTITKEQFDRALSQTAARSGLDSVPKPTSKQFPDIKDAAIGDLLDTVWIQSEAAEQGISVTDKEIADQLAQIKKQNFRTEAEYQQFIERSGYNQEEINLRVELQLLSEAIQAKVGKDTPKVSDSGVQDYYDAAKSQFEVPETRDVRLILNKETPCDNANDNRYTRSAQALRDWTADGILAQDSARSVYVYHQEATPGSPLMPNWTMKFGTTRKKRVSS